MSGNQAKDKKTEEDKGQVSLGERQIYSDEHCVSTDNFMLYSHSCVCATGILNYH